MGGMRILIDTNILIHLEDNKQVSNEYYKFYNSAIENHCRILHHKGTLSDLSNDSDQERKNIILSKLQKYQVLENPAYPSQEFLDSIHAKKGNDLIDAQLLYQVYIGYVELFITEDRELLKKAFQMQMKDRVMNIKDGLDFLLEHFRFEIPAHPILSHGSVREIIDRKNDSFFDSLREGYPDFDGWLEKCAKQDRSSYYLIVNDLISAILIYNEEAPRDHQLKGIQENALKICTFKVSENTFGHKIGELFLNKMFALCIEKKISFLYLTVYPNHDRLIGLIEFYGFYKLDTMVSGELIMVRDMNKNNIVANEMKNSPLNHPFYSDDSNFKKYVIPIEEQFSETLFKDSELREASLFDKFSVGEIQGNTIQKAYICNSRVKLEQNDLAFFYISKTKMKAEPVGIIDSYHRVSEFTELKSLVAKRTVYSDESILTQLKDKKELTVILFRLSYYLKKPIPYTELKELESCKNNLTTITKLSEEDYTILKKKGYFDERYIVN